MENGLKRKHVTLSMRDKLEILKRIDQGESYASLAVSYGVGKATIGGIRRNKERILSYTSQKDDDPLERKTLRPSFYPEVEHALFAWFLEERAKGVSIREDMVCEKAKFFYQTITQKLDFRASPAWCQGFKRRYNIRSSGGFLVSDAEESPPEKKVQETPNGDKTNKDVIQIVDDDDEKSNTSDVEMSDTVKHEDAVSAFNKCISWALQNDVSNEDLLVLQELQCKALDMSLKINN